MFAELQFYDVGIKNKKTADYLNISWFFFYLERYKLLWPHNAGIQNCRFKTVLQNSIS